MGIGDTLRERFGPLPVWAWTGILIIVVALYLSYRKRQQSHAEESQAATPNTPAVSTTNVPVSNLTTAAQPVPIQMGDTFVNAPGPAATVSSSTGIPNTTVISNPQANTPAASSLTPAAKPSTPAVTQFPTGQ